MPAYPLTLGRNSNKKRFNAFLNKLDYAINKKELDFVVASSKKHLGKTLQYRDASGTKAFSDAKVVVEHNLKKDSVAPRHVKYRVVMMDRNNNPHLIWHTISNGRDGNKFIMKKSVKFRLRKSVRTTRNTLNVKNFAGWSDNFGYLKAGDYLPEIEGRRWYESWLTSYLKKHHKSTKYFYENIDLVGNYEIKG